MKLILKRTIENLGQAGEVVSVKPGYARNYLVPQGLAYEASEANLRRLEGEQRAEKESSRREYLEARRRSSQLEGISLAYTARASEEGRLFGSVSVTDIVGELGARGLDFEVERRHVVMEEPIKEIGVCHVPIRLAPEVEVSIEVRVDREDA